MFRFGSSTLFLPFQPNSFLNETNFDDPKYSQLVLCVLLLRSDLTNPERQWIYILVGWSN